ncbi:Transcription factor [Nymphaea thermarum]|nr:Transcription factor [Nymphaea thermarum]
MADDLQGGVCSGNWWARSGGGFGGTSSSLCAATAPMPELGNSFGWSSEITEVKARSGEESVDNHSNSVSSGGSMVFQEASKQDSGGVLMDSSLQLAGFDLSPSMAPDWGHALIRGGGRAEGSVHTMLQEEDLNSLPIFRREQSMSSGHFHKDWACGTDSNINVMKQMQQNGFFGLDQRLNSRDSSISGRSTNVSMNNFSSYGCPSAMLQGLIDQEAHLINMPTMNCRLNSQSLSADEFSPSWPKFPQFLKPASSSSSSSPHKHHPSSQLQFQNSAPFWNATATMAADIRPTLYACPPPQFLSPAFEDKPSIHDIISKRNAEEIRDVSSPDMKKSSSTESFKRPRIETPTPLPTFKVRKEKLSDRVTALQQLVSPFGKVLSNPYMKSGAQMHQHHQNSDKPKVHEGPKQDLRSRGLCLVPISSTFPSEATADFWTPTFGLNYR